MALSTKGMKAAVAITAAEQAGDGKVVVYTGKEAPPMERVSSGSFLLDWALSGGLARGRIYQFAGKPSSGKSTLALNACVQVVQNGGNALWACIEDFDWTYARSIGVPMDDQFALAQSAEGDALCDAVVGAVKSGQWDIIVVDSVGALSSSTYSMDKEGEWSKGVGEQDRGGIGRLLSNFMKRLSSGFNGITTTKVRRNRIMAAIAREKSSKRPSKKVIDKLTAAIPADPREPAVVIINQVRDKGLSGGFGGIDNPGGWALKHHKAADVTFTSVGLLWPGGKEEDDDGSQRFKKVVPGLLARDVHISIVKHKVGIPYRAGRLRIGQMPIEGFQMGHPHRPFEIVQLGLMYGVVVQSGSWYSIGGAKWQGEGAVCKALAEEEGLMEATEKEIMKRAGLA